MNIRKLYNYIARAGGLSLNRIGIYVAGNPECNGALDYLINCGYVAERDGIYSITDTPFFEDADDESPDTD